MAQGIIVILSGRLSSARHRPRGSRKWQGHQWQLGHALLTHSVRNDEGFGLGSYGNLICGLLMNQRVFHREYSHGVHTRVLQDGAPQQSYYFHSPSEDREWRLELHLSRPLTLPAEKLSQQMSLCSIGSAPVMRVLKQFNPVQWESPRISVGRLWTLMVVPQNLALRWTKPEELHLHEEWSVMERKQVGRMVWDTEVLPAADRQKVPAQQHFLSLSLQSW